ncbi:MAG: serine/threonine protein kinase [Polyangiaceae bacterium]|jgi:serine/threonine protein kinase|nr:serine/threonine protein kinase [Polyangiaceae bacterium]MBK8938328.1 serine/threonine protein kinase [Polyangiaceae bacterium]
MIRCPHCGLLHVSSRQVCPATGQAIQAAEPRQERRSERRISRSSRAPAERIQIGGVLDDRYRVLGVIGQGGMGTVYEAEHLNIGRRVALKVLKPENAQKPDAIARLRHEARVVSQIGHPNICEVFDIGQFEDGVPYLVMERLRGETLAQRLERPPPLQLGELADVMTQVLAALEAAHRKGVIHRDMKPDNIFLAQRAIGTVAKVLDFGISKAQGPDERPHHLTRTGMVMGTPYYMAPEQAMGERNLDGRVDVWGVAVALYEALAGQRPFVARNYNALLVQILTVPARPILELRPDLPQAFDLVLRKALEKRRDARYSSAKELSDALAPFRAHRPPSTTRKSSRSGLPRVSLFGSDEPSSLTTSDEEPTMEMAGSGREAVASEDAGPSDEETPTIEENDPTVVDVPTFTEGDYIPDKRRR